MQLSSAVSAVILAVLVSSCLSEEDIQTDEQGTCSKGDTSCENVKNEGEEAGDNKNTVLYQHSFENIGDVEEFDIEGKVYTLKSLSELPAVYEIEDLLSEDECLSVQKLAKESGMENSVTINKQSPHRQTKLHDMNRDKKLDLNEMMLTIEDNFDIYLETADILSVYKKLDMDKNDDGLISMEELKVIQPEEFERYLQKYVQSNPHKHSRYSEQAWLYPATSEDKVFLDIQNRVQRITKLPEVLIKKSDFQVVKYPPGGHYNAHHDSSSLSAKYPCCTPQTRPPCRLCRYMTVLVYLNDVEEGGQTAFIVAGNETVDTTKIRMEHKVNLQKYCLDAPLVVAPKRGKAILWYNHFVNKETGWMGSMDINTWHGGCPVIKGNKWVANFWIKVSDNKERDLS